MTEHSSDRRQKPGHRTEEVVSPVVWGGIAALVQSLITSGAFGAKYPELCPSGQGFIGTNETALSLAVKAEIPGLTWPLTTTEKIHHGFWIEKRPFAPATQLVLDLIEFCYRTVAKPIKDSHHKDLEHYHLRFDEKEGKQTFIDDINRILSRNNIVYELSNTGQMVKHTSEGSHIRLSTTKFDTGNPTLDRMLEDANVKFINPDPSIHRQSLEDLWNCWDLLQTLELPENKEHFLKSLLSEAVVDKAFLSVLDAETRTLNVIGNTFHLRHPATARSSVTDPAQIDYLFHRLNNLIQFILSQCDTLP